MVVISIQELTRETGVTVRTLRYYDQIDLLKPSGKTEGGHRLYSEVDVIRLQQILFLKEMGFSLKEAANMLVKGELNLKDSLEKQLRFVQEEQKKFNRMERVLQAVVYSVDVEEILIGKLCLNLFSFRNSLLVYVKYSKMKCFQRKNKSCFTICRI